MKTYKVEKEDAGIRLDRWFKRHQPEVPHAMLSKLLRKGLVRVNGKKAEANFRPEEGDEIVIKALILTGENKPAPTPKAADAFTHSNYNFDDMILFENNDYVIINKPPGLASQGGSGIKYSVDDMIREISERYKLVHRLDKDTSGVLAIAKKTTAASKFSDLLKRKQMTKIYWALVKGVPEHYKGTIKLPLAKKGARMEKVEVDWEEGKTAITEYSVMETLTTRMSWLELLPITGRTHQLRVHCAAMGCPIIGDGKYGGSDAFVQGVSNSLHLHARRLIVPELGIDVTAELPKHMLPISPEA